MCACIPSWGISVSKPLLKSGVLSQWVVCCSSGEGGAPWSIPPRQRPTSRATVRSRSTNHTQHCAGPDTHNGSTRSGVPTGRKKKEKFSQYKIFEWKKNSPNSKQYHRFKAKEVQHKWEMSGSWVIRPGPTRGPHQTPKGHTRLFKII